MLHTIHRNSQIGTDDRKIAKLSHGGDVEVVSTGRTRP
jgi:hypothetical protein